MSRGCWTAIRPLFVNRTGISTPVDLLVTSGRGVDVSHGNISLASYVRNWGRRTRFLVPCPSLDKGGAASTTGVVGGTFMLTWGAGLGPGEDTSSMMDRGFLWKGTEDVRAVLDTKVHLKNDVHKENLLLQWWLNLRRPV